MSTFTDIAAQVEAFAAAAVAEGEKELAAFVAAAEQVGEEVIEKVEPIVETSLSVLTSQFGTLASQLVVSLAGAAGAGLTGTAKANLGATTLIQGALAQGVTIVESDASTLIKNAYVAVDDLLTAKLAPAAG